MIIKSKNYYENHARKILANNIVYFRIKKNWSQEDFADELGTTPTYVSGLENLFIERPTVTNHRIPRR